MSLLLEFGAKSLDRFDLLMEAVQSSFTSPLVSPGSLEGVSTNPPGAHESPIPSPKEQRLNGVESPEESSYENRQECYPPKWFQSARLLFPYTLLQTDFLDNAFPKDLRERRTKQLATWEKQLRATLPRSRGLTIDDLYRLMTLATLLRPTPLWS